MKVLRLLKLITPSLCCGGDWTAENVISTLRTSLSGFAYPPSSMERIPLCVWPR
jgi:hypothetical protein